VVDEEGGGFLTSDSVATKKVPPAPPPKQFTAVHPTAVAAAAAEDAYEGFGAEEGFGDDVSDAGFGAPQPSTVEATTKKVPPPPPPKEATAAPKPAKVAPAPPPKQAKGQDGRGGAKKGVGELDETTTEADWFTEPEDEESMRQMIGASGQVGDFFVVPDAAVAPHCTITVRNATGELEKHLVERVRIAGMDACRVKDEKKSFPTIAALVYFYSAGGSSSAAGLKGTQLLIDEDDAEDLRQHFETEMPKFTAVREAKKKAKAAAAGEKKKVPPTPPPKQSPA
jgi:hypothetical protein